MAKLLKGKDVVENLNEKLSKKVNELKTKGINPTLAILRVGEKADDLSYERGAIKRCQLVGVDVKVVALSVDVSENEFFDALDKLNNDITIHGILMFRPLPRHIDEAKARNMLSPAKDVDGSTDLSLAGVFTNTKLGFSPCTAEAAMEILKYYNIPLSGKKVAVIGRSLVIGRPIAMLLMHENATVTICHTKTVDVPGITKNADIVVVASGQMESVGADYLRENQTVIDVGISWNSEKNKLCGDVKFDEVEGIVDAITPVPGGVGGVTTSILVKHVIEAAVRQNS
ncbi:MAG: bifunctional 5,10-methylenetetrahydrofolate dehydrogenase/5,10-methenyltetrahydrofolate cyclohydrolase [Pseudobutyrivibrio sp.]|uniref:bifunctional 5,10-methylenetetrahydrofolate dehydrogenase/5,10-methenyltetrahydrofolate cyclohydrolase n=1 Tax=Pseudobutyrivibrio sp. TaxID=2014367 RepID=UPI0025F1E863|nr:bifunctional 5,10-methylenetetrahydrofolate dehydrogenase/5,10-methenyltetrahydrofolate cyclohydrolase [Pseudobutyrivibrio sp.]MBQ6462681.1 bifunctional 5,10-methylenetetrahydrofolate dehydrogenase/5,10-methenyltetrahydrofolate cyclohydrolase [Pseudobutyrivibrio sp.]